MVRLAQSFGEWRAAARELIARGVAPADVEWQSLAGRRRPVFNRARGARDTSAPPLRLPRQLVELLESAACFNVADRWAFLYQVLWRWQQGQRDVISPADADGARLHGMAKAVRREEHDMHAYVRFREREETQGAPRFVAWFEPVHDVLPQVARHFARRMGPISWMIATPGATMLWDGETLHAGAGADARPGRYRRRRRSAVADLLPQHLQPRAPERRPAAQPYPVALLEKSAGRRHRAGHGQQRRQRRTPHRPDRHRRPAQRRGHDPDLRRTRPAAARAPTTLDQCRRCELWKSATQAVPGAGPAQAPIMLVGEQPGDQEDLAGLPFVGPAGAVLERAMREAGVARDSIYLTNAVKHFKWEPRGKRRLHKTPAQREIAACHDWLEQELASVKPQVIVALGSTALKSILQDGAATMTPLIGTPVQHQGRWVVTVYHPSYVLRAPDEESKRQAYRVIVEGLRQAMRLIDGDEPVVPD